MSVKSKEVSRDEGGYQQNLYTGIFRVRDGVVVRMKNTENSTSGPPEVFIGHVLGGRL